MPISEADYKDVIRLLKGLIPDFRYSRNLSKLDRETCHGLYDADIDLILFGRSSFYLSKEQFLRVGLHELAHWSLRVGAKRARGIPNKLNSVAETIEEIIAETVAKRLFKVFSDSKYKDDWYIRRYKRLLRKNTNKSYYKELLRYIDSKVDEVVNFMLKYNS